MPLSFSSKASRWSSSDGSVAAAFAGARQPQVHASEFTADDVRFVDRGIGIEAQPVAGGVESFRRQC